jgi:molybdate transport system substrate-binding protein
LRPTRLVPFPMMPRRVALVALALLLAASGCGGAEPGDGVGAQQQLTVFAAASLRGTFSRLGASFEADHPGTAVTFSFAGSSDLVTQLQGGARADVLATADLTNMDKAVEDQLVLGERVVFASNILEIVVPRGNPAGISSFADLGRPGLQLVVCAPQVPCGAAARQVAAAARTTLTPVSEESAVTDVLNKVRTGEADAGLVYATDVKAAGGQIEGVPFPQARTVVNRYPIAVLSGSDRQDLAREFVALVTGPEGRRELGAAGFGRG